MRTRQAADTDVGRVRRHNEDGFLVAPPLFAVADGMGGHEAGDVASSVALETLTSTTGPGDEPAATWMTASIADANAAVYRAGTERDALLLRPGTTLTSAFAADDAVYIGHVGDSRAYLCRDGQLSQITNDHSLVAEWVREGRISEAEAKTHPKRSVITRALGIEASVDVDIYKVVPLASDRMLLCSDGLSGFVDDDAIEAVLAETADPNAAVRRLIDLANEAGGEDNITCVIIDFLDSATASGTDPTQPIALVDGTAATMAAGAATGPTPAADPARADSENGTERLGAVTADADPDNSAPADSTDEAAGSTRGDVATLTDADTGLDPDRGADAVGIIVHEPGAEPEPPASAKRKDRRLGFVPKFVIWAIVLVVVVVGGWLGFTWFTSNSYYVGVEAGNVAIFRGVPDTLLGFSSSDLYERSNVSVSQLPDVQQEKLEDGIQVDSLEDARSTVSNMSELARDSQPTTTTTTTPPPPPPNPGPPP